jgi:hypothetical protein
LRIKLLTQGTLDFLRFNTQSSFTVGKIAL